MEVRSRQSVTDLHTGWAAMLEPRSRCDVDLVRAVVRPMDAPSALFKALLALAVLVGVVASLFVGVLMGFYCSDGDGGVPYVADDSAQADVCAATGGGLGLIVIAIAGVLGLAFLALWIACRAEPSGRRWPRVLAVVAVAGFPLLAMYGYNAPSDHCSAADEAAYEANGGPPPDCAHY